MIDRLIFTPEADVDVAESYAWYEEREPGLGEDFLRCVEACLLTIQRHPQIFPVADAAVRRGPIRRFPFEFFYEVIEGCLVVLAVFHCSQDPNKWKARLGGD